MINIKYYIQKLIGLFLDKPIILPGKTTGFSLVRSEVSELSVSKDKSRIYPPFKLKKVEIGDYTYIAKNCDITNTVIGKFCSIGPNFCCGLGIHPTNGISTSPMFYSVAKQNGMSLTEKNKVEETKQTIIEHDVFIGANVTILDGVTIGNGAVIGAGAVVTRDIPPYAIVAGVPAKVIKYRLDEKQIGELQKIEWWNYSKHELQRVEKHFFDLEKFIQTND